MDVSLSHLIQTPPYVLRESSAPIRPVDRAAQPARDGDQRVARGVAAPVHNPTSLTDSRILLAAQEQAGEERKAAADDQGQRRGKRTDATVLGDAERRQVQEYRQRDAEVRQHEQAHSSAGVGITGATSFDYERGPDGRLYAVGGEVKIDVGRAATPEATIRKMDLVVRAALAPVEPSGQDRAVAAQARSVKQQAQQELQAEKIDEASSEQNGILESWKNEETQSLRTGPNAADLDRGARAYAQAAQTLPRLDQMIDMQQRIELIA